MTVQNVICTQGLSLIGDGGIEKSHPCKLGLWPLFRCWVLCWMCGRACHCIHLAHLHEWDFSIPPLPSNYSSFVFKIHWYRNTFFIHQYNKNDNSMWSSIFWETHWYCLLGVYVIDPVWQSSLLALEHDSLLDNTKVQRSNRKALFFK